MATLKDSQKNLRRKTAGLDDRHRDGDGEIRNKHGDTRIGTLRRTYGEDFASGYRSDTKLRTVLEQSGARSLSDLLRNRGDARISDSSRAIIERAATTYRIALKRLANK
jgi:hypothetical protein